MSIYDETVTRLVMENEELRELNAERLGKLEETISRLSASHSDLYALLQTIDAEMFLLRLDFAELKEEVNKAHDG